MVATGFFLLSLFAVALGNPLARRAMTVHESRSDVPVGFVKQGPAAPDTVLDMRIALTQTDPEGLTDALMAVSTPGNALYQKFLTQDEVAKFTAPTKETADAVSAFLKENGITAQSISPAGDFLAFQTTVAKANEMFAADFSVFQEQDSGKLNLVTMEYSLPSALTQHVQFVHPTISFTRNTFTPPAFKPLKDVQPLASHPGNVSSDASVPASCVNVVTPACVQALYGVPATPATQSSNKISVAGFIDQFANNADLQSFLKALRPDIKAGTTFALQTLDGGTNSQTLSDAGVEADLDTQYTVGVATGVPVTFVSCGNNIKDSVGGFMDWSQFINSQASPPQVVTTSYGENENEISRAAANGLCNLFQQLGAKGTSVFYSSGDGGVGGSQSTRCTTFLATFPSGCPFMTSVGATQMNGQTSGVVETAASFSSGGFSNFFGTGSFQTSAVSGFLSKLGNTNSGKFNRTGRGFPDVAAIGNDVEIFSGGEEGLVAGTSCSSPIFASIISLINDRLAAQGKGPLGFLNPFLYGVAASTFTDITTGDNPGCNTNGFPAVAGWDPVTGLGTPNFAALLAAAESVS
ncbi:S53 family peptidase [Phanerochaete sordida]|uniref:S53 family peptidase n=1 Tax=Phanerochaete sordida TaxID=48140 RepID=A0A9P3LHU5_9APHY|nr:S53 family peptidase [Phanerochaete sordida]